MEIGSKIKAALDTKGISREGLTFAFLGEGAWHEAYLLNTKELDRCVIRFPKAVSYGNPFMYNENVLMADYGGRGLYYELARKVDPKMCPPLYTYHVQPDNSFTLESYMGPTISLRQTDVRQAADWGRQCGSFVRAMNGVCLDISGFGFLEWREGKLAGNTKGDFQSYWVEDTEGNWEQLEQLAQAWSGLDVGKVKERLETILPFRTKRVPKLVLTNRDLSPENLIVNGDRLRIIDPLPLYYDGDVFAGNLLHNFNTLFPSFYRSPRYAKHNFHFYAQQLRGFADGFLDGYTQGDEELRFSVLAEEYLMLFDSTYSHVNLLQKEFNEGLILRVGDRSAVEERIPGYLARLEQFKFN